ncbi:MAG: hypothetical protein HC888_16570 [Candidatus Competibacteraceae bacterium]|nr:hypothetical protein [Candidatus Competibacteraceae bacterium]
MFENVETAITVREHMANLIWLLTASATTSPLTECPQEEQNQYTLIVSEICELINTKVIRTIENTHTSIPKLKYVNYGVSERRG